MIQPIFFFRWGGYSEIFNLCSSEESLNVLIQTSRESSLRTYLGILMAILLRPCIHKIETFEENKTTKNYCNGFGSGLFNPLITNGTHMSHMSNLFTYGDIRKYDFTNLIGLPVPLIQ